MSACKIPQLFRDDENYWREKLAAFLHDPPDKALSLWGHIKRAGYLKEELYVSAPEELVKRADQVASGLDRTFLPEKEDGGEIKFPEHPWITHPTGKAPALNIGPINTCSSDAILSLIQKDEATLPKKQPQRAFALFHYFRHVLPHRLAEENVANLGWRWLHLPADTRLPDHSIWQHCALTSALYSCYRLSPERKASLVVFSITPVQDFIARSRKLRDHWTASLLLSWLASEGLKALIMHYGSDHIIYPSPLGQALIEAFLDKEGNFDRWAFRYHRYPQAATLPNKFLFMAPAEEEENACALVQGHLKRSWLGLARSVEALVKEHCFQDVPPECLQAFERIFNRQAGRFWEFHWAALPLPEEKAVEEQAAFLPERLRAKFQDILRQARSCALPYLTYTEKFFYPLAYDLLGRGMAAEKLSAKEQRAVEPGLKCHLHPDHEALRFSCVECRQEACPFTGKKPQHNPRPSQDPCWQRIRNGSSKTDFKKTERLSAIGLIKRLAYRAVPKNHPLYGFFKEAERFPSTTEMALSTWYEQIQKELEGLSLKDVAEFLHRQERSEHEKKDYEIKELDDSKVQLIEKVLTSLPKEKLPKISDRYYALLTMDGDHMGRLLSGGFAACWRDVLHPELVRRLEAGEIAERFWPGFWKEHLEERRTLSPATHAAISQALADFALYTVPRIVARHRGRLIYAGGDDVCAVLPVSSALQAAWEIAQAYSWAFVRYGRRRALVRREGQVVGPEAVTEEVTDPAFLQDGDLLLKHLGPGDKEAPISISAGLLIVHHKWPLRPAIEAAHALLDLAKSAGRAALALQLHRRAGEQRTFVAGFRDKKHGLNVWQAFSKVVEVLAGRKLSSSFAYRPAQLEDGLRVLSNEDMVLLVRSQMKRSQMKQDAQDADLDELAHFVATVLFGGRNERGLCQEGLSKLAVEALEIAGFLAEAVRRNDK